MESYDSFKYVPTGSIKSEKNPRKSDFTQIKRLFCWKIFSVKKNCGLWNPIFNYEIFKTDCADCSVKMVAYTSIFKRLMKEFERVEELVWMARKRTSMNTCYGWIATFLSSNEYSRFETKIPAKGKRFLLTRVGCRVKTGYYDMTIWAENLVLFWW